MGKCDKMLSKASMDINTWIGDQGSVNCKANPDRAQVNFIIKNRMGSRLEIELNCSSYNSIFRNNGTFVHLPPIPGATAVWSSATSLTLTKTGQTLNIQETIRCDYNYRYGNGPLLIPFDHADLVVDL